MSTIDDLNTSISELSTEELMQRISQLRKARRIQPEKRYVKKKTPAKPKVTAGKSLAALLKNLTKEEMIALLKEES